MEFIPAAQISASLNDAIHAESSISSVAKSKDFCDLIKSSSITSLIHDGHIDTLKLALDGKDLSVKENSVHCINTMLREFGPAFEPYLLEYLFSSISTICGDKNSKLQDAASALVINFVTMASPYAVKEILPHVYEGMGGRWQIRLVMLDALSKLIEKSPEMFSELLPECIPHVTECLHELKPEVSAAATRTMKDLCKVCGNPDIAPHLNTLISCMARPTEVEECIKKISSTTFVAEVTGSTLAIMVPLLVRALNERSANVLRSTCIITDNLCKLVRDPKDAAQFLPQLIPGLDKIIETAAFPEIRALATAARTTLHAAGGDIEDVNKFNAHIPNLKDLEIFITEEIKRSVENPKIIDSSTSVIITYSANIIRELIILENYKEQEWINGIVPYFKNFINEDIITKTAKNIHRERARLDKERRMREAGLSEDEGEEICNCDFSLAYGGMMLLTRTTLRLIRGRRYGLCGPNGAGKTTLMTAISKGRVDNFPSQDELRSVMVVSHSLQGEDLTLDGPDFILTDKRLKGITRDDIIKSLEDVGFSDELIKKDVGSLSGGWKMKLELVRAILLKADLLLLDEPTNHLDVQNVAWLESYLVSQSQLSVLVVSHDSGFLDNVCTDIIHYERKKLAYYKGNLSKFVEQKPEAKTYYTLSTSNLKFTFPPPGFLQGINSKTKNILKMTNATYTYPGASKPNLNNVTLGISLSSRIAVIGRNGAGKSTLIKVLTGEAIPQEGTVWKHPNLRIGYVAQHAFHHLNQHLEKTANEYIQWRYQGGEDREVLEKESRQLTADDEKQMNVLVDHPKHGKVKIEAIVGRSKLKKSFQYELKFEGLLPKFNINMSREDLLQLGFTKLVLSFDDRLASKEGQGYRELIPSVIRKHIEDVGLDGDVADYNPLGGLSGGQKVKVVIAAAMWNNPHILVLDEPTNYLDRDSLGGLAVAIRDWGGAVVMISHNTEFVGALCPEQITIENGQITSRTNAGVNDDAFEDNNSPITSKADEEEELKMQKKIEEKVKSKTKKKKMTRNELKAREVRQRQRHLNFLQTGVREPDTDEE